MKNILAAIVFSSILSSCAFVNAPSGSGLFYTEVKEVIYYDPYVKPTQKTTLCSENIFGLSRGDASLDAFHLTSSIRKISSIEKTYSSRMSLISESCTIIKGE